MSETNKIQNEEELWDLLSEPVTTEPKADKPKAPKFLRPESKAEAPAKPEPVVKAEPAVEAEPIVEAVPAVKAEPVEKAEPAPKSGRKIDGFFVACMAGVAAVSVAATLIVSSMLGGSSSDPGASPQNPVAGDTSITQSDPAYATDLELENAELRAQLEQQKEQIKDLQSDLITLMGSEEFFATASTDPSEGNEVLDAQMQALETFAQLQEAYADFDRAKLEELIPQMDEQLEYLTPDMLNNYYLILEYVEQPSNG